MKLTGLITIIIKLITGVMFVHTCMLISCHEVNDTKLEKVLRLAGKNKTELEKVLEHFKNDPQKLKAAEFLIVNMPGSFAQSEEIIDICAPFYYDYDSLAREYGYKMNDERGKKIDSLWDNFSNRHFKLRSLPFQSDLENISAEQLISEIDLAFQAWKGNIYTRDCSFDEFCEYILPYRRINGLVIDDARQIFYERHHADYFIHPGKDMIDETDSLLYEYNRLTHSRFWGTRIPVLTASTFEYLRHGLCEDRCWYNSLLLSSLGMATAVDLVPAWGNRNSSHTWNVLIREGESYAFEAFWDNDRWKYKKIYNNNTFDHLWGKFRLPKVYRHSFKNYIEGPVADKRVNREDIPPLFRNIKKKDVSPEYFETADVTLSLKDILPEARYAYLCVFGYQQWHPVQWGKINRNKVTFTGMGKDIVYLPACYKNNRLMPAGEPFLLDSAGNMVPLTGNGKELSLSVHQVGGAASYSRNRENIYLLHGLKITGYSRDRDNNPHDILLTLPDTIPLESVIYPVKTDRPYNHIVAHFRSDTTAISEITFYDEQNRIITPDYIEATIIPFDKDDSLSFVSDLIIASGIKGLNKERTIRFHFNKETKISSVRIAPYIENIVKLGDLHTLYYWHNGWKEIDTQETSIGFLTFQHVPDNHLYMLRNRRLAKSNPNSYERIFLYKDGEVLWY